MPRRKSFRKRYNKSKQTRRIRKMRKMKTRKLTRGGSILSKASDIVSDSRKSVYYHTIGTKYQEVIELRKLDKQIKAQRDESMKMRKGSFWYLEQYIMQMYNLPNYGGGITDRKDHERYEDDLYNKEHNEDFKKLVNSIQDRDDYWVSVYKKMYEYNISLLIKNVGNNESKESITTKFKEIKTVVNTFIANLELVRESYQYKFWTGDRSVIENLEYYPSWFGSYSAANTHFEADMALIYKLKALLNNAIAKFEGNTSNDPVMPGEEQTRQEEERLEAVPEIREQGPGEQGAQEQGAQVAAIQEPETAVQVPEQVPEPETAVQETEQEPEQEQETEQEPETKSASGGKRRLRKSRKTKK
jgi:hypothetical protein